jgi:hypothetical protein
MGQKERKIEHTHPAVNRHLQQSLPNLHLTRTIIHRTSNMHRQLIGPIQRTQHRYIKQTSMFALESGTSPDGAPASFGYELLHGAREVARAVLESSVDVC